MTALISRSKEVKFIVEVLFSLLLCWVSLPTWAYEAKPLAEYMTENGPIDLRNASSQFSLSIPMSRRAPITKATLHLRATNSISLLGNRSQLVILMNGQVVAQIALNPKQPEIDADIDLPVFAFNPGYNTLTFSVAQHYIDKCEDPSSPELWIQIDSIHSTLSLEAPLRSWQPHLSELADVFDPKLPGKKQIDIITPGTDKLSDAQLTWGALVAQGASLRFQYETTLIKHVFATQRPMMSSALGGLNQQGLSGVDSILVGTREQLTGLLSADEIKRITHSFLAVYPLDSDPSHFVLVVSGQTAADVTMAARAFALLNFPFPDKTKTLVANLTLPNLPDYLAHNTVYPNGHYTFKSLGFYSRTVQGMNPESLELTVNIPPALFAKPDDRVELHLRYAYGAGMRQDSVLNILINGRFENVVALNNSSGGYYRDYIISIPLLSFKPGANTLRFSPYLMPLVTGNCQSIQTGNLIFTLFAESEIRMPNAAYHISMPNLSLMASTGFPYTVESTGKNVTVYVPDADGNSASAAWMLLGKFSQHTRLPMFDVQVTAHPQHYAGEWIVMAPVNWLPLNMMRDAPMQWGGKNWNARVPYTLSSDTQVGSADLSWAQRLWNFITKLFMLNRLGNEAKVAYMTDIASEFGRYAAVLQYQAPWGQQQTMTVFTADSSVVLADHLATLIQPDKWDELSGDYVVWRDGKGELSSQQVGSEYTYGKVGLSSRLEYYFNEHPIFWLGFLFVVVLALSLTTLRLLMRYKRRYHKGVIEREHDDD